MFISGIRARLLGGFSFLVFMMILLTGVAMWEIDSMTRSAENIYDHSMATTNAILAADGNMIRVHRGMKDVALAKTPEDVQKAVAAVDQFEKLMYTDLQMAKKATPELATMIEKTEHLLRDWKAFRDNTIALSLDGKKEEAALRTKNEGAALVMAITKAMGQLKEEARQVGQLSYEDTQKSKRQSTWIFGLLTGVGIVLALGVGFWVSKSITRPLDEALGISEAIAEGDLRSPIRGHGNDEFGRLLMAMRRMQSNLSEIVTDVRVNSERVAAASIQIAQGNQELSSRTEEQASALEETAATMDQLGSTVRNTADNAKQANQFAQAAAVVATQGGTVVGQVVGTMQGISESSRKIGDIIGVIDGIAFQTNILALNAAVEAARAGEQGRGFAVVAGEVRSLAQRSAEAAKEIKNLITRNVEQVEQGTSLVDTAGKTMDEIVLSIKRVSDIVGEISSATSEQSGGIQQVGDAVSQMDQVTQQNAALVEESAAAAESLHSQAQQLVQSVSVFKLADTANRTQLSLT